MSFLEKVKNISDLTVVDEFGGRGNPKFITKFYLVLRLFDDNGEEIELTFTDLIDAISNNHIVFSDYIGTTNYTLGVDASDQKSDFIASDFVYRNGCNIITILVNSFASNASICVKIESTTDVIISSTYLGGEPSCCYLEKKI